jgi:alpha-L-rhamnosidase
MADVVPTRLTCEYLEAPLAVESMEPRLSWVLESDQRSVMQSAYHVQAATSLELLEQDSADLWDSGKVAGRDSIQIQYKGRPLSSAEDVYWRVRVWTDKDKPSEWSEPGYWRMGLLKTTDWQARWVSHPREVNDAHDSDPLPAPVFRKEFELSKPVKRALVYVSALGVYELRLNGEKTGDHILAPEWTNYHKHLQYQVYDVSDQVSKGTNAIGAMVGDGWYAGRLGISHIVNKQHFRAHYGKKLQLIVQLDVTYEDGSTERIVTDPTWRTTDEGPIRKACLLDGETYDATKALTGWDTAGFDDSEWTPCLVGDSVPAKLIAQPNEPIRVTEERSPIAIGEPAPGIYVVDFGQNLAGWCRIKLNEKKGTRVRLRHAEMLQEDGNIYRTNLRMGTSHDEFGAEQEDVYICSGEAEEYYEPHFTYHGFRYVEVTGLESKLSREDIVARAFHSAPPMTGSFESSSELLNKLMSNIVWTHRSNMHSVPTDCPQRDERMGWMGDMLVFAQPACFNMDMAAFFTKWMRDIADDQADDGRFPDFAPHPYEPDKRFSGAPAWGDAGVVIPYRMYVNYADQRICREYFDEMRQWVDWIHRENPSLLWENNRNNDYGDWLNGDTLKLEGYPTGGAEVPKDVFATAMFYMSTDMLAKMADIIGRDAEAREYSELANSIREAFIQAYVDHDGKIKGHTQSAYALALHLDLVPDNLREAAANHMIQRIRDYKNHISTGFHTTIMLMNEM